MIPQVCDKYDKLDYWWKCNQLLSNLYPLWSEFMQRVFGQNILKFISETSTRNDKLPKKDAQE